MVMNMGFGEGRSKLVLVSGWRGKVHLLALSSQKLRQSSCTAENDQPALKEAEPELFG